MVTAKNPITGDTIATKPASDSYRDNFDAIFRKKASTPCDMGEMCLDCQPRGENDECPDKKEAPVCKFCYGIGYDASGYGCVCTRGGA